MAEGLELRLIWHVKEEFVLSGSYTCIIAEDQPQLIRWTRVVGTAWEALALCLAVWIAIKHFREHKRLGVSTGSTIRDCFAMLIKSQVLYFIGWAYNLNDHLHRWNSFCHSFVAVSCFDFGYFSQDLLVRQFVNYIWLLPSSFFIGFRFYGSSNLLWCYPLYLSRADICAGSTPYP